MKILGNRFTVKRGSIDVLFLLPTIIVASEGWAFHWLHAAAMVKYHPRWVRDLWREQDVDAVSKEMIESRVSHAPRSS